MEGNVVDIVVPDFDQYSRNDVCEQQGSNNIAANLLFFARNLFR